MLKSKKNLILLIAFVVFAAGPLFGQTVAEAGSEGKLIAVLKSDDASQKEKADACRQLAIIGGKDSIAPLAALLSDEKLSHMARYGLESNPDPAVDEAFRDALGKLKGRPLVGVIGSIGVRRDAKAVPALSKLLQNSNPDVAQGAARALGSIGNSAAAKALQSALVNAPSSYQLAICEGLFRCAEAFGKQSQPYEAIAIYDQLRKMDTAAHQVRGGALLGAILARGPEGLPLLREHLRSKDYILFSAAVQAAQEIKGSDVTKALTAEIKGLGADNQILIILALGKRRDARAVPALSGLAKSGDKSVRIAAIKAMPDIGDASAAPVLVGLMGDSDGEISKAAQEAMAALPGREVDAAVMAMLESSDTDRQLKALEMIERRRMTKVSSALLKATRDDDESVRTASIRLLGDLAGEVQFPMLVELLLDAKSPAEIRAAERALSTTCMREAKPTAGKVTIHKAVYRGVDGGGSADVTRKVAKMVEAGSLSIEASNANFGDAAPGIVKELRVEFAANGVTQTKTVREGRTMTLLVGATPEAFVDELCSALAKAPTPQKLALLRVLRVAQGPRALDAVRAATKDANAEISSEAISVLCGWPTADALPDVLELTRTATDRRVRILALRGIIRLIPLQDVTVQKKLAAFKEILPLVQRNEEKKLLLGVLGNINSPDAVAMIVPYLDEPATRKEASMGALAIAERLLKGPGAPRFASKLIKPLEKVIQVTNDAKTAQRAKGLLKQAQSKAK